MLRAQERVYSGMRERVRRFEIEPGTRLNIAEIAEEYDASSIPVREALARLSAEGLIEHEPQSGFMAPRVSLRRVIDDNTVVFLFLRHLTDLYFEAQPEGFIDELDRANEAIATKLREPEELATEVETTTRRMLDVMNSPKLASAVRAALDSSHFYRATYFRLFLPDDYIEGRRRYADALRAGDETLARMLVRQTQQQFSTGSRDVCREIVFMLADRS